MANHAMVNTRCEGATNPRRVISRGVGTPREQLPRHAEIVRSPGVVETRGTCLYLVPTCQHASSSFFSRIFVRHSLWIDPYQPGTLCYFTQQTTCEGYYCLFHPLFFCQARGFFAILNVFCDRIGTRLMLWRCWRTVFCVRDCRFISIWVLCLSVAFVINEVGSRRHSQYWNT